MEKALLKLTTKLLNRTEAEVKELINNEDGTLRDDAADVILSLQEENVKKLKTDKFNDGHKAAEGKYKAEKETLEAEIRTEFEDKIKTLEASKGKKEMTDDDIKKTEFFLKHESNTVSKEEFESVKNELATYKSTTERNKVIGSIKEKVWNLTSGRNPILEDSEMVATNRRNSYLSEFDNYDYQESNGTVYVMKDGARVENELGHPVTLKDLEEKVSKNYFVFKKQEAKSGSGTTTPKAPSGAGASELTEPKDEAEYNSVRAGISVHDKEGREKLVAFTNTYGPKFAN